MTHTADYDAGWSDAVEEALRRIPAYYNPDAVRILREMRAKARLIRPRLALAWDEGWRAYSDNMNDGDWLPDSMRDEQNPYRVLPPAEGDA